MSLPEFSMRNLLEAGVHFGHQTHRWNPKMDKFIFGQRRGVHILDLSLTVPLLHTALQEVSDTVAKGGHVLFVGTKSSASSIVAAAARSAGQHYVNARWLRGMLVNWKTISNSIKRLEELDAILNSTPYDFEKKDLLQLSRERDKLERALGGIRNMDGVPDLVLVIDTNRESLAIEEARKLGIPVCAVVDSNSDPKGIDFPIPGNDDSKKAISLYCDLFAKAALDGVARSLALKHSDLDSRKLNSTDYENTSKTDHLSFGQEVFEEILDSNLQSVTLSRTELNDDDLSKLNVTQKRIEENWGEINSAQTAIEIIENIKLSANYFDDELHFEQLVDFFDDTKKQEEVFSALNILCNSKFHIFAVNFIFFDEEQKYSVSLENYRHSVSSGNFTHPNTGLIVEDFEAKLFPVFSLAISPSIQGSNS